jgi:hypothetical protein
MYKALSTPELIALKSTLYIATEEAYGMASLAAGNQDWAGRYRLIHVEVVRLFLEVGQELLARFGSTPEFMAAGPEFLQEPELITTP